MGLTTGTRHVKFGSMYEERAYLGRTAQDALFMNTRLVVHELFHALENAMEITQDDGTKYKEARETLPNDFIRDGLPEPFMEWQQSKSNGNNEIFADMGVAWVYNQWGGTKDPILSVNMSQWMDMRMPHFTQVALKNQR